MMERAWRTLDFRPAAPGWQAVYLDGAEPPGVVVMALPGWLVQEECLVDEDGYNIVSAVAPPNRDRRVVAAEHEGGDLLPAQEADPDFWFVLSPGGDVPSPEDVAREISLRRERSRIREAARVARAAR